jgi:teichuronic acid exporter
VHNLESKTNHAYKWAFMNQFGGQLIILAINLVLIRLLAPSDFGCFAIPMLCYSFFRLVQDLGFGDVIIKEKVFEPRLASSIFWMSVVVSFILALLCFIASPLVTHLVTCEDAPTMMAWLSLGILVGGIQLGFGVYNKKMLAFDVQFRIDMISNVLSGTLAIYAAYSGWSWMSLVVRTLSLEVLSCFFSFLFTKWRPLFLFDKALLNQHWSFAKLNLGQLVLNFFSTNIDSIFLGRFFSVKDIGFYDRSYRLFNIPLVQVSSIVSKVMMPSLSYVKDDKQALKNAFYKTLKLVMIIILPAACIISFFADVIVPIIFGEAWVAMVTLMRILVFVGVVQVFISLNSVMYYLVDKIDELFNITLWYRVVMYFAFLFLCLTFIGGTLVQLGLYVLIAHFVIGVLMFLNLRAKINE